METYDGAPPSGIALEDMTTEINEKVNFELMQVRSKGGSPLEMAKSVFEKLGTTYLGAWAQIEIWANKLQKATPGTKGKIYAPKLADSQYKDVTFSPLTTSFSPIMLVNKVLIGTDKLGHFFQLGFTEYFNKVHGNSHLKKADALVEGDKSELGLFGLKNTNVYSRADLAANHAGFDFYEEFIANPNMQFDISNYVNANWNEQVNSNYYEKSLGHDVWKTIINANWTGDVRGNWRNEVSWPTAPSRKIEIGFRSLPKELFADLSPVKLTGNFNFHHVQSDYRGLLSGQFVLCQDKNLQNAVTGIELTFQWSQEGSSGEANFRSYGEKRLEGWFGTRDGLIGGPCSLIRA